MTFTTIFFLKRCSTLNINKVLEALNNRLLEPVTDVQLVGKIYMQFIVGDYMGLDKYHSIC